MAATLGFTASLTSCSTSPERAPQSVLAQNAPPESARTPSSANPELLKLGLEQLTQNGDHFSPRFSQDESLIVYLADTKAAHRSTEVYIYNLAGKTHKRMTFSAGRASDALIRDNTLYYISNTDALKEKPTSLRAKDSPDFNDIFKVRLSDEATERMTRAETHHAQLRLGRTTVMWKQGHPKFRLHFLSAQGSAAALNFLPEAERLTVALNERTNTWAWVAFHPPLAEPLLQIKAIPDVGNSFSLSLIGLPSTEEVQLSWWSPQDQNYLFIQTDRDLGTNHIIAFHLEQKCFLKLDLSSTLPRHHVVSSLDFRTQSYQSVVSLKTEEHRQIFLSQSSIMKSLEDQLVSSTRKCVTEFPLEHRK